MKLTRNRLQTLVREEIQQLNEIETEKELKKEILEYKKNSTIIEQKRASIQSILDELNVLEKSNKKRFKNIEKFMIRFKIDKTKIDKWVAVVEKKLKYKVVRPDYKTLWLEYSKKVNKATRKVMDAMKNAQLELKSKETKDVLTIGEAVGDSLRKLWSRFKSLLDGFKVFGSLAKKQPKV